MNTLNKLLLYLVLPVVLLVCAAAAFSYHWVTRPLALPSEKIDLLVPAGATPAGIARLLNQAGVNIHAGAFVFLARATELDKKLKAGGYQMSRGDSILTVLRRIALGEVTSRQITIVEGWTLKQVRAAILNNPDIKKSEPVWTEQTIPRLIEGGTALKSLMKTVDSNPEILPLIKIRSDMSKEIFTIEQFLTAIQKLKVRSK